MFQHFQAFSAAVRYLGHSKHDWSILKSLVFCTLLVCCQEEYEYLGNFLAIFRRSFECVYRKLLEAFAKVFEIFKTTAWNYWSYARYNTLAFELFNCIEFMLYTAYVRVLIHYIVMHLTSGTRPQSPTCLVFFPSSLFVRYLAIFRASAAAAARLPGKSW